MNIRNNPVCGVLLTAVFSIGVATMTLSSAKAVESKKDLKTAMTGKGSSIESQRSSFGRNSYDPTFAQREDGVRFAHIRNHSEGGFVFAEFDAKDSYQAMETMLPDSFKRVRQAVWIPNTDNVALLVKTDEGADIYMIDCGVIVPITRTHDVLRMSVTKNGNSLSWERSGNSRYSVPETFYAINTNNLTVTRQSALSARTVARY